METEMDCPVGAEPLGESVKTQGGAWELFSTLRGLYLPSSMVCLSCNVPHLGQPEEKKRQS